MNHKSYSGFHLGTELGRSWDRVGALTDFLIYKHWISIVIHIRTQLSQLLRSALGKGCPYQLRQLNSDMNLKSYLGFHSGTELGRSSDRVGALTDFLRSKHWISIVIHIRMQLSQLLCTALGKGCPYQLRQLNSDMKHKWYWMFSFRNEVKTEFRRDVYWFSNV